MNIWMILLDWIKSKRADAHREWAHVPAPNWACSRRRTGGHYW